MEVDYPLCLGLEVPGTRGERVLGNEGRPGFPPAKGLQSDGPETELARVEQKVPAGLPLQLLESKGGIEFHKAMGISDASVFRRD
jgi:hypothetical protein